jgi:hypothetical protein
MRFKESEAAIVDMPGRIFIGLCTPGILLIILTWTSPLTSSWIPLHHCCIVRQTLRMDRGGFVAGCSCNFHGWRWNIWIRSGCSVWSKFQHICYCVTFLFRRLADLENLLENLKHVQSPEFRARCRKVFWARSTVGSLFLLAKLAPVVLVLQV